MGRDQLSKLKECPHFRGRFCTIKHTSEHFKVSLIQDRGVCISGGMIRGAGPIVHKTRALILGTVQQTAN